MSVIDTVFQMWDMWWLCHGFDQKTSNQFGFGWQQSMVAKSGTYLRIWIWICHCYSRFKTGLFLLKTSYLGAIC